MKGMVTVQGITVITCRRYEVLPQLLSVYHENLKAGKFPVTLQKGAAIVFYLVWLSTGRVLKGLEKLQ